MVCVITKEFSSVVSGRTLTRARYVVEKIRTHVRTVTGPVMRRKETVQPPGEPAEAPAVAGKGKRLYKLLVIMG